MATEVEDGERLEKFTALMRRDQLEACPAELPLTLENYYTTDGA